MHPYIPHLLEDIVRAHQAGHLKIAKEQSLEEILEQFDQVRSEPGHTLAYYCGLNPEDFPPPDQLLKKEMKLVSQAFKKMLQTWDIHCYLPRQLPTDMVYTLLIKTLERRFDPNLGGVTFGYCNLKPNECLLKEFCACKK